MAAGGSVPRRNARYTPLAVDGPLPWQMVLGVPEIRADPLAFLERTVAEHGDLVAFPLPRTPVLLVNEPDGARRVLQDNHRGYGKRTVQYASLSAVTGAGLLTADGRDWRRHRRIAQPAFHRERLQALAAHAAEAGARLLAEWAGAPGGVLDVDAALQRTALQVVARALFDDAELAGAGGVLVQAVDRALAAVVLTARSPLPPAVPSPARARLRRAVRVLDAACLQVVRRRRARPDAGDDLLGLLLAGLGDREVRDELVTFVIAGGETVASCLTWALWLLAGSPAAQEAVHAELDAELGPGLPSWADVPRLRVVRSVVDEALRLYPPAWVISRRALAPDVVCGVAVPAGSLLLVSPWLLHRRPQSWPQPDLFRPERFAAAAGGSGPTTGSYLPFGAGPRLCIGRELALVEGVLVLAVLLRGHRVEPTSPDRPRLDALVTLRPRGGLQLRLAPR